MGSVIARAIATTQDKLSIDDDEIAFMSAPEAIEDNVDFMVATEGDQIKPWLVYKEENRQNKYYDNLKIDYVLELLEPCEQLEETFKLYMRTAIAQGEDWAVTMEKTMKTAKEHVHIAEEIYKQVKND